MERFKDGKILELSGVFTGETVELEGIIRYVFTEVQDCENEKLLRSRVLVSFIHGDMLGLESIKNQRIKIEGACVNMYDHILINEADFK